MLVVSREDTMMLGLFTINGEPYQFTVRELGLRLGVPPIAFNQYVKCQWPESCNKDEIIQRMLGQVPNVSSSTVWHENMSIVSKIMFMYIICNVYPHREGRENIAIEDYLLVEELLKI